MILFPGWPCCTTPRGTLHIRAYVEGASQSTRADLTGMERGENMKKIFVWIYTLAPPSSAEWETWLNAVDDYDAGFDRKEVEGDLKKNTRRDHQGLLESGAHRQRVPMFLLFSKSYCCPRMLLPKLFSVYLYCGPGLPFLFFSGFPGGSVGNESTCNAGDCLQHRECMFSPWGSKIPWRGKWQPTAVLLPGKNGQRSLVGYSQTWLSN